jgi:hypothetical protein
MLEISCISAKWWNNPWIPVSYHPIYHW